MFKCESINKFVCVHVYMCITFPTTLDMNIHEIGITVTSTSTTYLLDIRYFTLK